MYVDGKMPYHDLECIYFTLRFILNIKKFHKRNTQNTQHIFLILEHNDMTETYLFIYFAYKIN